MKTLTLLICTALSFATLNAAKAAPKAKAERADNFTQEVINQVNRVRTNPQAYAAYLERFRPYYSADGLFHAPGRRTRRLGDDRHPDPRVGELRAARARGQGDRR